MGSRTPTLQCTTTIVFCAVASRNADRDASVRHAQAAIRNGQGDALALTFAGFSMGMDAHDRTIGGGADGLIRYAARPPVHRTAG